MKLMKLMESTKVMELLTMMMMAILDFRFLQRFWIFVFHSDSLETFSLLHEKCAIKIANRVEVVFNVDGQLHVVLVLKRVGAEGDNMPTYFERYASCL